MYVARGVDIVLAPAVNWVKIDKEHEQAGGSETGYIDIGTSRDISN